MKNNKNTVSLPEAVFQGLSSAGPMLNLFGLLPVIIGIVFRLTFIVMVISTSIGFLTVYTGYTFSKYMRTNGGYYSYVGSILGKRAGIFTSVVYLSYGFMTFPSIVLFFDFFTVSIFPGTFISSVMGQLIISVIVIVLIITVASSKFKITMRYIMVSSIVEITAITAIVIYVLINYSPHAIMFQSSSSSSLITALPFGILSFAGIGSSIFLSDNTKNWKTNTNRSVMISFLILSVLMIVPATAFSVYFSSNYLSTYSVSPINALNFGSGYMEKILHIILIIIVMNSAMNLSVGYLNAFRRVVEKLSADGIIRSTFLSSGNRKFSLTLLTLSVFTVFASVLSVGSYIGFIIVSGSVSLLFLVVHMISNTALMKFFYNKKRFLKVIVPVFSVISFVFILVEETRIPGELQLPASITAFMILFSLIITVLFKNSTEHYSKIKFNIEIIDD
ncbi:MAG: amino acid permease [Thermoplasmata archaeon]